MCSICSIPIFGTFFPMSILVWCNGAQPYTFGMELSELNV